MRRRLPALVSLALVFSVIGSFGRQLAAEDELVSGPPAGTKLTPISVYAASGPDAGKEFDAAGRIGEAPGAVLFIHELTRNTAPVIRGVSELGQEFSAAGFKAQVILLHDDRTRGEERIKTVSGAMRMARPLVLSLDGLDGPGGYALNRRATLTLVTAAKGKVVRSVAYTDTGPQDLPDLRKYVEEVVGDSLREAVLAKLPKNADELRDHAVGLELELQRLRRRVAQLEQQAERMNMRNRRMQGRNQRPQPQARPAPTPPSEKKRVGKAPDDAELRSLLRQVISRFSSSEDVDEAFKEIDEYVGDNKGLEAQAVEMFKLLLSLDYGSDHAQLMAKAYLASRGAEIPGEGDKPKERAREPKPRAGEAQKTDPPKKSEDGKKPERIRRERKKPQRETREF